MQTDPPENRGLAALMAASGAAGLILLFTSNGTRSFTLALVAFACFIVSIALLGLGSVLRQHELWRAWSERERLRDENAAGENAS